VGPEPRGGANDADDPDAVDPAHEDGDAVEAETADGELRLRTGCDVSGAGLLLRLAITPARCFARGFSSCRRRASLPAAAAALYKNNTCRQTRAEYTGYPQPKIPRE
jgi:hypothetical protein